MFLGCLLLSHMSVSSSIYLVRYCYHDISWTAWTILIKLRGNIHWPLLMTRFNSGGQRSRTQKAVAVKSCDHYISWTTWAVTMKLTGNNHQLLLLTWLDFGGQESKVKVTHWFKYVVVEASTSTPGCRSLSSSLYISCRFHDAVENYPPSSFFYALSLDPWGKEHWSFTPGLWRQFIWDQWLLWHWWLGDGWSIRPLKTLDTYPPKFWYRTSGGWNWGKTGWSRFIRQMMLVEILMSLLWRNEDTRDIC